MKKLGALKYFLHIEIARGFDGLFLCQHKYAIDIIVEAVCSAPSHANSHEEEP